MPLMPILTLAAAMATPAATPPTPATVALPIAVQAPSPSTVPSSPPAAVVLFFDRSGAERTLLLRGTSNAMTHRPLTAEDPVRVASISKLTVAIAVMRLVDQHKLRLDADLSTYLGWRLRHPAYPNRPITLAMLLGHRSGLTDGGDYGFPLDADLETELQNPMWWSTQRRPGGTFEYANVGFPVVAAVMEGATGERFDALMDRLVFRPLRIDACFNWVRCSDDAIARAVTLYRPNGDVAKDDLRGARPACPVVPARDGGCDLSLYRLTRSSASFSPQGGLRISPRGLSRIGQMMLREGEGLLSRRSWQQLQRLTPVEPAGSQNGLLCRYGLAMHSMGPETGRTGATCRADLLGDGHSYIGHTGDAYSLRSGLFVAPEQGVGVTWFVTQVPEAAPPGASSAFSAAEEATLREAGMVRRP